MKTTIDKTVKISSENHFRLKELSAVTGQKLCFMINKAIDNFLKTQKKTKE